ncbi:MAG: CopC domain [Solirubrobacteraceae bacterium]|jgi:methionine-rich copper-binding protein CopC|nr:CopC domain [Solirubrobacteraceae bacterium]
MRTPSIRAAVLGAALAGGLAAVPAHAHAPVVGTFPAKGATVAPIRTVSVRFGEAIIAGRISVARSDGSVVAAPAAGLDPRNHARLRATFARRLTPGRYTVSWRARADDGHSERGTFRFRVR